MGKKGKDAKRREKKQRTGKKHLSLKPQDYYEVSGDSVTRKRKNCPRCGPGTWLGEHKGRLYCGKCGYTEFERRVEQPRQAEAPKEKPAENLADSKPPEAPVEKPADQKPSEKPPETPSGEKPSPEKPAQTN